ITFTNSQGQDLVMARIPRDYFLSSADVEEKEIVNYLISTVENLENGLVSGIVLPVEFELTYKQPQTVANTVVNLVFPSITKVHKVGDVLVAYVGESE